MAGGGRGMNLDDARRAWQSQTMPEESTMSEDEMLQLVKERSIEKRGLITPEEFRDIADRVLASANRA